MVLPATEGKIRMVSFPQSVCVSRLPPLHKFRLRTVAASTTGAPTVFVSCSP